MYIGFVFEKVCLLRVNQIKEKLGIRGVYTKCNSWYCKRNDELGNNGSQIDLLIVRKDQVINLCEMKFSNVPLAITDKLLSSINGKTNNLRLVTKTQYAIHPTLLSHIGPYVGRA